MPTGVYTRVKKWTWSDKSKKKLGNSVRGRVLSASTKQKISRGMIGINTWMTGKKHTRLD